MDGWRGAAALDREFSSGSACAPCGDDDAAAAAATAALENCPELSLDRPPSGTKKAS